MTILHRNLDNLRNITIILSSVIIGLEVSELYPDKNIYLITFIVSILSCVFFVYLNIMLFKIGLNEEYWTFTIVSIVSSLIVFNTSGLLKYYHKEV